MLAQLLAAPSPLRSARGIDLDFPLLAGCLALWGWRGYQHWKRRQAADR